MNNLDENGKIKILFRLQFIINYNTITPIRLYWVHAFLFNNCYIAGWNIM